MKKTMLCTLMGLFVALPSAYADEKSRTFYDKCIEAEIQYCQVRAERMSSRSAHIRKDAEKAIQETEYFESNRDALIQKMDQEGIKIMNYKVRRYLLDAFYETRLVRE